MRQTRAGAPPDHDDGRYEQYGGKRGDAAEQRSQRQAPDQPDEERQPTAAQQRQSCGGESEWTAA